MERYFNKLKQFRCMAMRYYKHLESFLTAIKAASARTWLHSCEPLPNKFLLLQRRPKAVF